MENEKPNNETEEIKTVLDYGQEHAILLWHHTRSTWGEFFHDGWDSGRGGHCLYINRLSQMGARDLANNCLLLEDSKIDVRAFITSAVALKAEELQIEMLRKGGKVPKGTVLHTMHKRFNIIDPDRTYII